MVGGHHVRRSVALTIRSLFAAADEDAATGGPDLIRGIYPMVAIIDTDGFRLLDDDDVAARAQDLLADPSAAATRAGRRVSREHAVLRLSRADDEGPRRLRAEGHRRGRSLVALVCAAGVVIVAENPSRTLYKISEIYDRIAFAGVGKYNEFQSLKIGGVRLADLKGYQYSPEDMNAGGLANAYRKRSGRCSPTR